MACFAMTPTLGATMLFWGLLWAGFCIGLCAGYWRAAPRLLGWAALACLVHVYTLWLIPPWPMWASWLGLASPAELRTLSWPAPLNWIGKSVGVGCSLAWVYMLCRTTPAAAGLVRPIPGSMRAVVPVTWVVTIGLLVEAYGARYAFLPLRVDHYLYYLVLPGLDEERFYRGTLLGLLAPRLPRTLPLPGTRTSWGGVVGVLLFTLGHRLSFPDRLFTLGFGPDWWRYMQLWWSPVYFPWHTVLFQLGIGTFFLWVRERTGSVWAAVVVHCLCNSCLALGHALG